MGPIKVLLVDNEEVFREGLARLIDGQPNMDVVHQCAERTEAVLKASETKPDVVLIDSRTSESDIGNLVSEIMKASPDSKVALFARTGDEIAFVDTMKAGARACLAKNISAADLVKSIELVSSGRIIISPAFADKFLQQMGTGTSEEAKADTQVQGAISERELEVVRLVASGASNKEIAADLVIAENTVKVHLKNIMNKLELRNRQQLVAYAVLRNWVTLDGIPEEGREPSE
ncbi:MAG: hypothetical protein A2147_05910 [Chloroflexi bacterium RBG_16_57_8]|nr:MAG: hypothetical protein A2147_05910 [Chloroflexi bacterium RBG_16_57_8]